jgi:flavin-binding protein dodecin
VIDYFGYVSGSDINHNRRSNNKKNNTAVAKIVEIIGASNKGWEDAAQVAIDEAKKTIHNIHGIKIQDMTASIS